MVKVIVGNMDPEKLTLDDPNKRHLVAEVSLKVGILLSGFKPLLMRRLPLMDSSLTFVTTCTSGA